MPKAPTQPQFGEHGGIDRRREGNREERQNAILAGKIERRRTAPHRGDKGPGAEHEAGLGEGQGPTRRMMLAECQKFMLKTLDVARANPPLRSIQRREGECADGIIL